MRVSSTCKTRGVALLHLPIQLGVTEVLDMRMLSKIWYRYHLVFSVESLKNPVNCKYSQFWYKHYHVWVHTLLKRLKYAGQCLYVIMTCNMTIISNLTMICSSKKIRSISSRERLSRVSLLRWWHSTKMPA